LALLSLVAFLGVVAIAGALHLVRAIMSGLASKVLAEGAFGKTDIDRAGRNCNLMRIGVFS
jgi:hypothetical protein